MATYTTRTTIIVSLLVGSLLTPFLPEAEATTASLPGFTTTSKAPETIDPIFTNETDEIAYEWTHDLFSTAGLEFPRAAVEFHDNEEACGGARGRAYFTDENLTTIVVCATHDNPAVEETWRKRTLLHELSHAWIDQNVIDENLSSFTELRGLEEWSSREVNWEHRATEHAAEILMWGMQDGDYNIDFRIDGTSCDELSAGYELLTGISISCEA
ncbi:MAG: hypothetical protein QNJ75_12475 [Acidimicrobiia bacterium]|nr:hypothetical protein [Acidimicrobiia bacterium]